MVTRLELAYDREVGRARRNLATLAGRQWRSLKSWREQDAEAFIARLAPSVEATQQRIADLTDGYLSRSAASLTGEAIRRGPTAVATTEALRGVPVEEVYFRPFKTVYAQLNKNKPLSSALDSGLKRLVSLTNTGSELAVTHSTRKALERGSVKTYERVLKGEVDCALCVIASTQRYWHGDLMPIHPGCDCGVRAVDGDPGEQVIKPGLLEQIHAAVETQFGGTDRGARYIDGLKVVQYADGERLADYTDVMVTQLHGELGPVLTWRDQHFTGARDLAA